MPRTLTTFCLASLAVFFTRASTASASWDEVAFDVVGSGLPYSALQPSIANGVDYDTETICEDGGECSLEDPVPVTVVAWIDTANSNAVMLSTRRGEPGEPWTTELIWEDAGAHPQVVLDRDGRFYLTFLDLDTFFSRVRIARRTAPGQGNAGDDDSILVRHGMPGEALTPVPLTLQYYGWDANPTDSLRGIHMVWSAEGTLRHSWLPEAAFEGPGAADPRTSIIGAYTDFWSNETVYEPDLVGGTWPDAAPLWTDVRTDADEILAYEQLPAISYLDLGSVEFRRAEVPSHSFYLPTPVHTHDWRDELNIGGYGDLRTSIDAGRDGPPNVVWAPACPTGGNLVFRKSEVREPFHINEWEGTEWVGAENACEPEISLHRDLTPYIAFTDPFAELVELAVKPSEDVGWQIDTIAQGSEPTLDYNLETDLHSIAYVDHYTGELIVVDGTFQ